MIDSEYSTNIFKSLNISIRTVMRNPEILKFVPDHLKTKKLCRHAVKKLPYLLRYVPDQYRTQKMCDKAILENRGALKSVLYYYQEMCNCVIKLLIITLMH